MGKKEQQRQKKLAKKRSKEIAKKKEVARQKNRMQSLDGQIDSASKGPLVRCLVSQGLTESDGLKIGSVIVARRMQDGRVMIVRYLVDAMCLGVKDIDAGVNTSAGLAEILKMSPEEFDSVDPATAKKVVHDAVAFAAGNGLDPDPKYRRVEPIFAGVDAEGDDLRIQWGGPGGKPHFMPGPHDSPARVQEVIERLDETLGEGGFDVTLNDKLVDNLVGQFGWSPGQLEDDEDGGWMDDPELD